MNHSVKQMIYFIDIESIFFKLAYVTSKSYNKSWLTPLNKQIRSQEVQSMENLVCEK